MSHAALVLLLSAASQVLPALPHGGRVSLQLVTDRELYHVGEAVHLTLTLANLGDAPLFGYPRLEPHLPVDLETSSLFYCLVGGPCTEFVATPSGAEERCLIVTPTKLTPGARERSDFVVALNPGTGLLVLEVPGEYEFRWTTWGLHEQRGPSTRARGRLLSTSAFVRVLPVPRSEEEAFAYYREHHLAELAQRDTAYFTERPGLYGAARTLLARYPDSLYAVAIRAGLLDLLQSREWRGPLSPEDAELLAELRAERRAHGSGR